MRLSSFLIASIGVVLLSACETQQAGVTAPPGNGAEDIAALPSQPDAVTSLVADFETLAFAGVGWSKRRVLQRMEPPLIYSVTDNTQHEHAAQYNKEINDALSRLEANAGIRFVKPTKFDQAGWPVFSPAQRGFIFFFAPQSDIVELLQDDPATREGVLRTGCSSSPGYSPSGLTYGAAIFILAERSSTNRSYCINRAMMTSMGLGGFLPRTDSVFSNSTAVPNLSARDFALVRMLYDSRLHNGMTPAQVRPLLSEIATDALAR